MKKNLINLRICILSHLNDALELTYLIALENYNRFNFENKLWNIHIDMDEIIKSI